MREREDSGLVVRSYFSWNFTTQPTMSVYKYNICHGFSNQLLYHAGPIAIAVEQGFDEIHVPAYFITNGVQTEFDYILPSENNSVPFNFVFDDAFFASAISKLGIKVTFKRFDRWEDAPKCSGRPILEKAQPRLINEILKAFRPSLYMLLLIEKVMNNLGDTSKSVCLHHMGEFVD